MQIRDEWEGGSQDDYATFGEQHPSFRKIREAIIKDSGSQLTEPEIIKLVELTRGLKKEDILTTTENYFLHKILPSQPSHPTNTCHPLTGSWTERLLTQNEYKKIFDEAKFNLVVENGFYNQWKQNSLTSIIMKLANLIVKVMGKYAAPYIILIGKPQST
jgi:hypothetical protein